MENDSLNNTAPPGTRVMLIRAFTKLGFGSRKQAHEWIRAGRVSVNGEIVKYPFYWVDVQQDAISLDEQKLVSSLQSKYVLLHKPVGYLTTHQDQIGRPTVYDLLPDFGTWIFPVGRLDMDSEGLLLLTNDGPMGEWIIHPKSEIPKIYRVRIDQPLSERHRQVLEGGMDLGTYKTNPAKVDLLSSDSDEHWIEIRICEGKNRQIRLMLGALGYKVIRLIRTHIGPLQLGELASGKWRDMSKEELGELNRLKNSRK
jgi:23S rRNA pseudouridine2605 synthase